MYLSNLPIEILASIASLGSSADQEALHRTSKHLHRVCLPYLYYDVDLSVHDLPELNPVGIGPSSNIQISDALESKILQLRRAQHKFLETLTQYPQRGSFTRRLKWTFGVESPSRSKFGTIKTPHICKYHEALKVLTSVRILDIGCLPNSCDQWIQHTNFEDAVSIRLLGQMSLEVFQSILKSTPRSSLKSLTLDNISFEGMIGPRSKACADPASGHLFPLLNSFSSLENLIIRLPGNDNNKYNWRDFDDDKRYAELGSFLNSVRPTLQHLTLEHGPFEEEYDPLPPRCGNPYLRHQDRKHDRPMDVRFREHILPLFQKSGIWPELRSLELRGVGQWVFHQSEALMRGSRMREIDCEIVNGIKKALGPDVNVTVALENSRYFTPYGYIPSIGCKVGPKYMALFLDETEDEAECESE